jgi:polysaccharide pyruvyl transferase WcaK-like protein
MSFPKFGNIVEKLGIPYILWGASIGPFSANPKAERDFTNHLKKLSLITARESETVGYLHSLDISDNVVFCADPAYMVAPEINAEEHCSNKQFTIGINLSPLSVDFSGLSETNIILSQAKKIEELIQLYDAHIILIPHVICDFNEKDDDLSYLHKVKHALEPKYQKAVSLLESQNGFIGTKKELIKCDLIIAARMHCAVNALSANIPTILLAYSKKAIGMCQFVYGNQNWVLPLRDFSNKKILNDKISSMRYNTSQIKDYLKNRIIDIREEACQPIKRVKEIILVK